MDFSDSVKILIVLDYLIKLNLNNGIKYSVLYFCFFLSGSAAAEGMGVCGNILTGFSWLLILVTLPFSLFICFKVRLVMNLINNDNFLEKLSH